MTPVPNTPRKDGARRLLRRLKVEEMIAIAAIVLAIIALTAQALTAHEAQMAHEATQGTTIASAPARVAPPTAGTVTP